MSAIPEIEEVVDQVGVRKALSEVLASASFRNSPQLSAFLTYVVEKTLAGKANTIKAYSIAVEALGRANSFDPVTDATVRVMAGRVRAALEVHYLRNPKSSCVVIELLPGSYVPQFRTITPLQLMPQSESAEAVVIRPTQFQHDTTVKGGARNELAERLLILEDDPDIRAILHKIASSSGFIAVDTAGVNEFWVAYRALRPSHMFLDLVLPGADGLDIMRELGKMGSKSRITLISGVDQRLLRTTERLGREFGLDVTPSIGKPFDIDVVKNVLSSPAGRPREIEAKEIADGIENSEFELYYQPKVDLSTPNARTVVGFEALARWNHPTRGLLAADSFIPLAEDSGLIAALTYKTIDLAINQLASLQGSLSGCTLAVNISASLLDDAALPDLIALKMDAAMVDRHRLVLEITETAASNDSTTRLDQITRLRLKGFSLSIDDFGTGYSSLLRLIQMPFSELKIDKYFVMESQSNGEARLIVEAVLKLCKSLGLKSCAEGVETQECLHMLREFGCDYAQGYLFSRPVPAEQILQVVEHIST